MESNRSVTVFSNEKNCNNKSLEEILENIKSLLISSPSRKKFFIGVCGIPGSGKSTFSRILKEKLSNAIVIPLDGYHILRKDLNEEQMKFRGRHDTFDLKRFKEDFLKIYESNSQADEKFYFPSFDHRVKDPVENDIATSGEMFYIFEGLYLFLNDLDIKKLFDVKIFLVSDINKAMERVSKRNFEAGITSTYEESLQRTDNSDKVNAIFVLENSNLEDKTDDVLFYPFIN
jgi:pantothenate kinase